jgi:hypothetical protein
LLLLCVTCAALLVLRISGWGDGGNLESDVQRPRRRSFVAETATVPGAASADGGFKLVVFKIGNADFDLAAWSWVRDFNLAGGVVE